MTRQTVADATDPGSVAAGRRFGIGLALPGASP
jgi:hypothetical protein